MMRLFIAIILLSFAQSVLAQESDAEFVSCLESMGAPIGSSGVAAAAKSIGSRL